MSERNFYLKVTGEQSHTVAQNLADHFEKEFGHKPGLTIDDGKVKRTHHKAVDPLALAAIVVSIPAAILACADIVERLQNKKKLDKILAWAKEQPGPVTIVTPEGTTIQLHNAQSGDLLDAAHSDSSIHQKGAGQ